MALELSLQARDFDIDFIRVSCHTLASSVRDEAQGWVKAIGQAMRDLDLATVSSLKDKISKYMTAIHIKPVTLDELKGVRGHSKALRKISSSGPPSSYLPLSNPTLHHLLRYLTRSRSSGPRAC